MDGYIFLHDAKISTTRSCAGTSATAAQLGSGQRHIWITTKPRTLQQAGWGEKNEEGQNKGVGGKSCREGSSEPTGWRTGDVDGL